MSTPEMSLMSETIGRSAAPAVDAAAFKREMDALRKETEASLTHDDYLHWLKLRRWGQACTALGYATAWVAPNPLSAVAIAVGNTSKWANVTHPISHRGLDAVPGVPARHTSKGFAKGMRRYWDWLDWIEPEAWHLEHDVLHHSYTGELNDPDLVEENIQAVRAAKLPKVLKYAVVGFYALTWKYTYYAPNTFQVLRRARKHRAAREAERGSAARRANADELDEREASAAATSVDTLAAYRAMFNPITDEGRAFWKTCLLPYGLTRFVALPLAFAPLGPWAVFSVWSNSVLAECLANIHTFVIIGPNHSGDDLYRFEASTNRHAEYYVRQVMGSVNYETGGDLRDFLHGFLNYQIEHHLFPALPPSAYQRIQPRVKELCAKYKVSYVQEPVFKRFRKLVDIMVGNTSMKRG
jgi:fatty acid desaturase